jgi:hypothetical protein
MRTINVGLPFSGHHRVAEEDARNGQKDKDQLADREQKDAAHDFNITMWP